MRKFDQTVAALFVLVLSSYAALAYAAAPAVPSPTTPAPVDASATPAAPTQPTAGPRPRHKPDPKDEPYSPNRPVTPAAPVTTVGAGAPMATAKAMAKPFPRLKPAIRVAAATPAPSSMKVLPRAKPPIKSAALATPPISPVPAAVSPSAPAQTPLPVAPTAAGASTCGDACNEILFRTLGDCLWVQNANPKPVAFAAQVGGRTVSLALAGADAAKADAHKPFEPKEGVPSPIGEGAYHTRISDPFSPSAPGIAVYRARIGTCVKSRTEVTSFTASFVRPQGGK